jgi:NAD dependent epimerase/dehydratase family enzyme
MPKGASKARTVVLHTLLPCFKQGLSGPVGSGRQYGSWMVLVQELR